MLGTLFKGKLGLRKEFIEASISGTVALKLRHTHCQNKNERILNFTKNNHRYIQNPKQQQSQGHAIQAPGKALEQDGRRSSRSPLGNEKQSSASPSRTDGTAVDPDSKETNFCSPHVSAAVPRHTLLSFLAVFLTSSSILLCRKENYTLKWTRQINLSLSRVSEPFLTHFL